MILSVSLTACDDGRVSLPDTPLSAVPPKYFVHNSAVFTQYPSIHFKLKEGRDHTTPGWPELSIEVLTSPIVDETAEAFLRRIETEAEADHRWVLRPRGTTIAATPATEFAYRSSVFVDTFGPGSE